MTFRIDESKIHGKGVIAQRPLQRGEIIGKGIDFKYWFDVLPIPFVTEDLGSWINHSYEPNCVLVWDNDAWCYWITAGVPIAANDEMTLDYRNTPWYIDGPEPHFS